MATESTRKIQINDNQHHKFIKNKISTTKYNVFTFVPRYLYEQFRKYANCYFLTIAMLQQIPDVSPTGRFTTLVPFIIILSLSAFKELIEDIKRKRSDDITNNRKVDTLQSKVWSVKRWSVLEVGSILKVNGGEPFPADMVLLSSSEPKGTCYIETANLDGETNLKVRQSLPLTAPLNAEGKLVSINGHLECEVPNKFLYDFVGNITIENSDTKPLGPDQLLLRGATLKNTKYIFGVVVYSGYETKLMLNSSQVPLKRSTVDKIVNKQILMLFIILLIMALISAVGALIYKSSLENEHWYLAFREDGYTNNFFFNILTFVILYNNLIPISLQVTLEMVKFIQALFIGWDNDMYHEASNKPAAARTSNLNEELGMVKYIFSDKTGTLTGNIMSLKLCSVNLRIYGKDFAEETDEFMLDDESLRGVYSQITDDSMLAIAKKDSLVNQFMMICASCHSVVPETEGSGINYQAASPDDKALVVGASKCGYKFIERTPDAIKIDVNGKKVVLKILNTIEFTSARKRMSVVFEDSLRNIHVYCKGADVEILHRLDPESTRYASALNSHLTYFSKLGLRTLCMAWKTLNRVEYNEWNKKFQAAANSIENREKKIDQVANLIERNFKLVGASAIEDKLQHGVPDTIFNLLAAGICVWVLTGDKEETAVNIGVSCRLLNSEMKLHTMHHESVEAITSFLSSIRESLLNGKKDKNALIINGKALTFALDKSCRKLFLECALNCKSVICCRVSPSQKAEIVKLVKENCVGSTLAIGDGANDVGMIQEAHIGVGISGEEGLQAVCASDYSIAQFRFLQKLILVHGNWNYNRVTKLILYCFYKNICFYFCEFWYAFLSAFSGQVIFERWTIAMYNVMFTALPPFTIGLFDKSTHEQTLLNNPYLYLIPQSSEMFNVKVFWLWCLNSVYVSLVMFWVPMLAVKHDVVFSDGRTGSYLYVGNIMYFIVIMTMCLKALLECTIWNKVILVLISSSMVVWAIFFLVYSNLWPYLPFADNMVGMDYYVLTSPMFWFLFILVPFTALLRDIIVKIYFTQDFSKNFYNTNSIEMTETPFNDGNAGFPNDVVDTMPTTKKELKNVQSKPLLVKKPTNQKL